MAVVHIRIISDWNSNNQHERENSGKELERKVRM